jgi:hypothetical protein
MDGRVVSSDVVRGAPYIYDISSLRVNYLRICNPTQQPNRQLQRGYKYSEQQADKIKTRDAKQKIKIK